jgi:hypothetical protein
MRQKRAVNRKRKFEETLQKSNGVETQKWRDGDSTLRAPNHKIYCTPSGNVGSLSFLTKMSEEGRKKNSKINNYPS